MLREGRLRDTRRPELLRLSRRHWSSGAGSCAISGARTLSAAPVAPFMLRSNEPSFHGLGIHLPEGFGPLDVIPLEFHQMLFATTHMLAEGFTVGTTASSVNSRWSMGGELRNVISGAGHCIDKLRPRFPIGAFTSHRIRHR